MGPLGLSFMLVFVSTLEINLCHPRLLAMNYKIGKRYMILSQRKQRKLIYSSDINSIDFLDVLRFISGLFYCKLFLLSDSYKDHSTAFGSQLVFPGDSLLILWYSSRSTRILFWLALCCAIFLCYSGGEISISSSWAIDYLLIYSPQPPAHENDCLPRSTQISIIFLPAGRRSSFSLPPHLPSSTFSLSISLSSLHNVLAV